MADKPSPLRSISEEEWDPGLSPAEVHRLFEEGRPPTTRLRGRRGPRPGCGDARAGAPLGEMSNASLPRWPRPMGFQRHIPLVGCGGPG